MQMCRLYLAEQKKQIIEHKLKTRLQHPTYKGHFISLHQKKLSRDRDWHCIPESKHSFFLNRFIFLSIIISSLLFSNKMVSVSSKYFFRQSVIISFKVTSFSFLLFLGCQPYFFRLSRNTF